MSKDHNSCKSHSGYSAHDPVHVTNLSRLPPNLLATRIPDIETIPALWFRNTEDECCIAINPKNPCNMIITTHQDRAAGFFLTNIVNYTLDGGKTWTQSHLVQSRNQGATLVGANDDFESASDPWVAFDSQGNAFALSTSFNQFNDFEEAFIVWKSADGGQSWSEATAVVRVDGFVDLYDKGSITADPYRKNNVYVVALNARAVLDPSIPTRTEFFRSVDGGASWTPPIVVEPTIFTWGAQLVVLPDEDHTLVITSGRNGPMKAFFVYRSTDVGDTWTSIVVRPPGSFTTPNPEDPGLATFDPPIPPNLVRVFQSTDTAVNKCNGYLYTTYGSNEFNPTGQTGIAIQMSKDGGLTWTPPIPANPTTLSVQTFQPQVAVADNGIVAVLFYDFRFFTPTDPSLATDVWVSFFDKNLNYLGELRLTPESFDTRQFMLVSDGRYFPGDYFRIQSSGNDFYAAFTITNPPYGIGPIPPPHDEFRLEPRNRQDVVFVKIENVPKCGADVALSRRNIIPVRNAVRKITARIVNTDDIADVDQDMKLRVNLIMDKKQHA